MPAKNDLEPHELRQLRPGAFLKTPGRIDELAEPGSEPAANFATAACLTFEDAEVSPQEFLTVFEAIKQCLDLSDASNPREKLEQAVSEAFDVTTSLLGKGINPAIVAWIREWTAFVVSDAGISAFLQHMNSVAKQYAIVMSLKHG